jgi:hypothetical protein
VTSLLDALPDLEKIVETSAHLVTVMAKRVVEVALGSP